MSGCCTGCRGTGYSAEPETNGLCWDCRGSGCAHEPHCDDKPPVFDEFASYACVVCRIQSDQPEDYAGKCSNGAEKHTVVRVGSS